MIIMLDIIEIFELLEDNRFSCEWGDSSTIGITQRKINTYSLEELANKVENVLCTLDNFFEKSWDSFEEKNDTIIFTDENSIKIIVY